MRAGNLDFMISRFPIRKFPRNFLMRTWVSDPKPMRKFLRNFLLRSRKKFKLFFLAGQPASQRARAHGPGPDPGPMGQGHGPGPGPMAQAIISEAANAADFKGGCGVAEPPPRKN